MEVSFFLGIFLLFIGIVIIYMGYKILDNRKKYEFENRTSGGVVEFKNWKATKRHALLKGVGKLIGVIGVLISGVGLVMILT